MLERSNVRGLLAGAAGGLIGGWFKLGWEVTWPPRTADRIAEPAVLVAMFTHAPAPLWLTLAIHFGFSVLAGIVFAALAAKYRIITPALGIVFGLAVWLGAHEIVMPAIGVTPPPWKLPANEQCSEFFGHALWGLVLALVFTCFRDRTQAAPPKSPLTIPIAESVAVF